MLFMLIFYIVFLLFYFVVFVNYLLPYLKKHLEITSNTELKYPKWIYKDEESNSAFKGTTRLAEDVVTYAVGRYEPNCKQQSLWHVFLQTASGLPIAVKFDKDSRVVEKKVYIERDSIAGVVLRKQALCSEDLLDSQFTSKRTVRDSSDEKLLTGLAQRYSYQIRWKTTDSSAYLVVVFVDRDTNKEIEFEFPDFLATAGKLGDLSSSNSLPAPWLLRRSPELQAQYDSNNNPGRDAPTSDLAGLTARVQSPCYDSVSNKVQPGLFPVSTLTQLERIYLRGVGSYDKSLVEKIKRLYFECRYDVPVDHQVAKEITRELPIRLYLRVCPSKTPNFDANLRACVRT